MLTLTEAQKQLLLSLDAEERLDAVAAMLAAYQDKERARGREYRKSRREAHRLYMREWRRKNPAKALKARRDTRKAHPETEARHRQRHKAARRQALKDWKARNPDKVYASNSRVWQRRRAQSLLARKPDKVLALIKPQLPGYLDRAARDDITADICAAIAARQIAFADLPTCAKPFVTAHNRMFDHFKTVSLDAPIPGMGDGTTYLDRLASAEA